MYIFLTKSRDEKLKGGIEDRILGVKSKQLLVFKAQVLAIITLPPVRLTTGNTGKPSLSVMDKKGSMAKGKGHFSLIGLYLLRGKKKSKGGVMPSLKVCLLRCPILGPFWRTP